MGSAALGWVRRWFQNATYSREHMTRAFRKAFKSYSNWVFDGLVSGRRVGVTVAGKDDFHILANYRPNHDPGFLSRLGYTASSTFATPLYFEPPLDSKRILWDGGVVTNNPVLLAVREAQTIWGKTIPFDLVLSVGTGQASHPYKRPELTRTLSPKLATQMDSLFNNINGEASWEVYGKATDARIKDRSVRLNVKFRNPIKYEPSNG